MRRAPANNAFQWRVSKQEYHDDMRSPNFCPHDPKIDWRMLLKQKEGLYGTELVFFSVSKKKISVKFQFSINGKSIPDIFNYDGISDESYITDIELRNFFIKTNGCTGFLYGTITASWTEFKCYTKDHATELMDDFGYLLSNGKFSDFTITTDNGSCFPVHRNVLFARVPALLKRTKTDSRILNFKNTSSTSVAALIRYWYTSSLPEFTMAMANELLKFADLFNQKSLKKACAQHLALHLSVANASQTLASADTYHARSLKRNALEFIVSNRKCFIREKFCELLEKPSLLVDVINSLTQL